MTGPTDSSNDPAGTGAVGLLLAAGAGRRMGRPKALVVSDDGEPWLVHAVRVLREGGCADVVVVLGAEAARARALLAGRADPVAAAGTGAPAGRAGDTGGDDSDTRSPTGTCSESGIGGTVGRFRIIEATDWQEGISASLRAGLAEVASAVRPSRTDRSGTPSSPTHTDPTGPSSSPTRGTFAVVTLVDLPELRPAAIRRLTAGATETSLRQASYGGRPGHPVVIGAAHFAALSATLSGDTGARPYLLAHGVESVDCTDLGGGDDVDGPRLGAR